MKVLILNTSEMTGGAAVAANRLTKALRQEGVDARMMVRDRLKTDSQAIGVGGCFGLWHKVWERIVIWMHLHLKKDRLWEIDIANSGCSVTRTKAFKESDVIHLNWVNQGMLSLKEVERICRSGKRIVWTMHDLWNATGICHYAHECTEWQGECRNCRLLPEGSKLAAKIWKKKQQLYKSADIRFVTCSRWLMNEARQSRLMQGQQIVSIPNAIDTDVFKPADKAEMRRRVGVAEDGRYVLFVSQKVTDERKGARFFIEAMNSLKANGAMEGVRVLLLGGHAEEVAEQLDVEACALGYISDPERIAAVYASADVFVLPSLQDNLPNTIMEALACGVPCVGFDTGGIPEMIDHRVNGYVATQSDSTDLADGIAYCLDSSRHAELSKAAREKVKRCYSYKAVAKEYMKEYTR